jgi:hypothetical protein
MRRGLGQNYQKEQLNKITRILDALDAVTNEEDILALGSGIHKLSGNLRDFWSKRSAPIIGLYFVWMRETFMTLIIWIIIKKGGLLCLKENYRPRTLAKYCVKCL